MIIPSPEESITAITVIFHKPLADWTPDDRAQILRRLREFMCKRSANLGRSRKDRGAIKSLRRKSDQQEGRGP